MIYDMPRWEHIFEIVDKVGNLKHRQKSANDIAHELVSLIFSVEVMN